MSTFLLELRNHAMKERNELARDQIRSIADDIQIAINDLVSAPTHASLERLNGLWARAHRYVAQGITREPPTIGGGAVKEGARLAA